VPEIAVSPLEELTGEHPAVTDDALTDMAAAEPLATEDPWAALDDPAAPPPDVEPSPWVDEPTGQNPAVTNQFMAVASDVPTPELEPSPLEGLAGGQPSVTSPLPAAVEEIPALEPIEVTDASMLVPSLDDLMEEAPEPAEAAPGGTSDESPLDLAGSLFGDPDELSPAPADPGPAPDDVPASEEVLSDASLLDTGSDLAAPSAEDEPESPAAPPDAEPVFEDSGAELDFGAETDTPSFAGEPDTAALPEAEAAEEAPGGGDDLDLGAAEVVGPEAVEVEEPEEEAAEPVPAVVVATQEATVDAAASVAVPAAFASDGAIQATARPVAPLAISANDTEINIPVEIALGPGGTTQLNLNIRLSLNLKVQP
jgi:hypothetical protein